MTEQVIFAGTDRSISDPRVGFFNLDMMNTPTEAGVLTGRWSREYRPVSPDGLRDIENRSSRYVKHTNGWIWCKTNETVQRQE